MQTKEKHKLSSQRYRNKLKDRKAAQSVLRNLIPNNNAPAYVGVFGI